MMAIVSSMLVERTERGDAMFMTMLQRHCEHVLDTDALAILPAPAAIEPLCPSTDDESAHTRDRRAAVERKLVCRLRRCCTRIRRLDPSRADPQSADGLAACPAVWPGPAHRRHRRLRGSAARRRVGGAHRRVRFHAFGRRPAANLPGRATRPRPVLCRPGRVAARRTRRTGRGGDRTGMDHRRHAVPVPGGNSVRNTLHGNRIRHRRWASLHPRRGTRPAGPLVGSAGLVEHGLALERAAPR